MQLEQEKAIKRSLPPVRVPMTFPRSLIVDLRQAGYLADDAAYDKEMIGRAAMRAITAGIRAAKDQGA